MELIDAAYPLLAGEELFCGWLDRMAGIGGWRC